VLYVDSSALVKHYIREPESASLKAKLNEASLHQHGVFISVLGYAEILALFARRLRENVLSESQARLLRDEFLDDWMFSLSPVELTVGVIGFIAELVNKHPLKGADAIHLASALWLRDALRLGKKFGSADRSLTFVSADIALNRAASAEGLEVFDPLENN